MEENLKYLPHGAAAELMGVRDPEVLIEGPAGTGKTRAVLQKLHYICLKYPQSRCLVTRKTRESLTQSVLVTYEKFVLPPECPICAGASREGRKSYLYPNGSELVVGGLVSGGKDQRAKIMSTEYDVIAAFEATELNEDDWEKLMTRLRNGRVHYQQGIADCNPDAPTHWLNRRAARGQMRRLLSRHEDNPVMFTDGGWTDQGREYLKRLDGLTGARRLRFRVGKWAASEGVVYEAFDAAVHLIDWFDPPSDWRRMRAIDFGYTNPFVCQWWAFDPDGRMYLYREIYRTRRLVEDHVAVINEFSAGERYERTVSDHDAEDRATAARYGLSTEPAWKSVTPGIQAVESRLKTAGDGKPRLFVMRNSLAEEPDEALLATKLPVCTADEFDGYVWPKGQDGKPVKEEPVKLNDHGMDTMRYAVVAEDGYGSSHAELAEMFFGVV